MRTFYSVIDALLKKGTNQHAEHADSKAWVHMFLHLPHAEAGFGVTFSDITKDAAFYTSTSRFVVWLVTFPQDRQVIWSPQDDLEDSSSWSSPRLVLLRDIHFTLVADYDCRDSASPQAQPGVRARVRHSSQDGDSEHQEAGSSLSSAA